MLLEESVESHIRKGKLRICDSYRHLYGMHCLSSYLSSCLLLMLVVLQQGLRYP